MWQTPAQQVDGERTARGRNGRRAAGRQSPNETRNSRNGDHITTPALQRATPGSPGSASSFVIASALLSGGGTSQRTSSRSRLISGSPRLKFGSKDSKAGESCDKWLDKIEEDEKNARYEDRSRDLLLASLLHDLRQYADEIEADRWKYEDISLF